jgi:hypothetical protein
MKCPCGGSLKATNTRDRSESLIKRPGAADKVGNFGTCSAVVTVPHDQGH